MAGPYKEFEQRFAAFLAERNKERWDAERAGAAREAREQMRAARVLARQVSLEELERLRVCGLITEVEYKNRLTVLLEM
ncbi:hypothetical protein [Streptomyces sp. NBC_01465]|uniref:hypothetical protein n=1 Tax=Streptomyces sp. NBC_01465 TaxID=2903878 RepID=UPI002E368C0B|nr:hypothetical protein [Streptomyces sp. NBC_01465]